MKYLKLFDSYNNPLDILKSYIPGFPLEKCVLEDNKISTYNYNIELNDLKIEQLQVEFKNVLKGHFNIDNNNLITLKGCPEKIPDGFFSCANNKTLMTLEYIPDAYRIYYDGCGCSDDPEQLKFIPLNPLKNGEVFNYYNSASETFFIYNQKDIDDFWDYTIEREPTVFDSLKYNKRNKREQKSNYISWELSEKYSYLKRGGVTDLWGFKKNK